MIETDYLVVGAGTSGMGFVDALLDHSDADIVMIDRRHRPGGHWLDAYPFVQLHQPSRTYGVNSTPLGFDRLETTGRDAGFYERASGSEIAGYFDEVMRHRFLDSGRVRFFPMSDYVGESRFRSLVTGTETEVAARRAIVDATYMETRVPATTAPPFDVADGVACLPVGELTHLREPYDRYVIIGAGKTAMDAACWLLDQDVDPARIQWIRPRDSWVLNRRFFQPGAGVVPTFEGIVLELEAVVSCNSADEVYERLEEHGVVLRLDPEVWPTVLRGATASVGELELLRRIDNVVRLGHVERIDTDVITLTEGSVATGPRTLHIHCATPGLSDKPPVPIFGDGTITIQPVSRVSISLSVALLGFLEASGRSTDEKNALCPPNPWPQTSFDFLRHILIGIRTESAWHAADLNAFRDATRFNLVGALGDAPDQAAVADLTGRFLNALFPAIEKLDVFAAQATPAEQARMFGYA